MCLVRKNRILGILQLMKIFQEPISCSHICPTFYTREPRLRRLLKGLHTRDNDAILESMVLLAGSALIVLIFAKRYFGNYNKHQVRFLKYFH